MKFTILGAGLVGGPMAKDLAADKGTHVLAVDADPQALARLRTVRRLRTLRADLSDPAAVERAVQGADVVISAVPGFLGFQTLDAILKAGKNVVDIAFFPEDPFSLDRLAGRKGLIAIVDCGVAPGMSSILAAHALSQFDKTKSITIYVGGLPEVREWPYEYKAVFSPLDVIEEYVRPARYVENGRMVVRPALSDPEFLNIPGIGTLEAFNTDGLRTMAKTLDVPNMKEKTLRYPGHIEKMAVLRETGFFDTEEVDAKGLRIRPIDFTAALLFPKWKLHPGEADITVMKIIIEGTRERKPVRITYDLLDRYDERTGVHSMARTTGYTATLAARMIARGLYRRKGISAPEHIGLEKRCVKYMREGLAERGVVYRETVESAQSS
ncbi:MAG: saccharopine dehydrogenase NADP-binding domain-containing protein [Candidatus Aminicenantes bacterium]|nr:saccharopine dehydrogenase NADP-binding domain-containing protein [Candidatus Aminicenantes bacterium]